MEAPVKNMGRAPSSTGDTILYGVSWQDMSQTRDLRKLFMVGIAWYDGCNVVFDVVFHQSLGRSPLGTQASTPSWPCGVLRVERSLG